MGYPKSIVIIGRRWHNKTFGHSVLSATAIVDGELVGKLDELYSYDPEWECAAALEKKGFLPLRITKDGKKESLASWCHRCGCTLYVEVIKVDRRKDLRG